MDITTRQKGVFSKAYNGHPDINRIMEAANKLNKEQAHQVISTFHGAEWYMTRLNNIPQEKKDRYKGMLFSGLEALEKYGYSPRCGICKAERSQCCC